MVKPQDAAGDFARSFAGHLRDVMREGHVTQAMIAEHMGRSQAFVSERTGGVRPVDVDLVAAIADLLGETPERLMGELIRRVSAE
jgi:plasmid maintenance system antidote protein VapI